MNSTTIRYKMLVSALLVSGLGWFGSVNAAVVNLCAGEYTQDVNGEMITMWGYADDAGGLGCTSTNPPSSPGPQIEVFPGDPIITISLRNTLPEATSLVIPGQRQASPMIPVAVGGGSIVAGSRVRSFTHETAATGGTNTYSWSNVKPGTYAYQSGTHPAVQVQMGLYGAVWHDAAVGEAYAGESYAAQAILLYSEIDPALHAAVAGGSYGVGCPNAPCTTSTVDYAPRYFLVNGEVFNGDNQEYVIGAPGQRTLVRFINMGLKMHAPTINGARAQVLAEDGNEYVDHRDQYSVQLSAGKTKDAIITVPDGAAFGARYSVYDRMLNLSNDGAPGAGGMMSYLTVGAPVTLPVALDDGPYAATEDTQLVVDELTGVLALDTTTDPGGLTASMVSGTSNGSVVLATNGSFTYDPDPDFAGSDSFVYAATDSVGSAMATATITVANFNDAPVAGDNAYSMSIADVSLSIAAPGVLGNDSDVDGDILSAAIVTDTVPASNLLPDGSLNFTPPAEGIYVLTYTASDASGPSNVATVTITVGPAPTNEAPVAVDDFGSVSQGGSIPGLNLVVNDTDAEDGTVVSNSVVIVTDVDPSRGSVVNNGDGTVTFTSENAVVGSNRPPRKGTATFTYTVMDLDAATSNEATVRINVTK